MRVLSVLIFFLTIGVGVSSWADKVYLKNGDVIEGNILSATDEATVVKVGANIYKYEAEKVEKVEREGAEDFVNPALEELTDEKRDLIKALLKANGVKKLVEGNVQKALASAPADKKAQYAEVFKTSVLIDLLIPIYAQKFSTKDLVKLVNFFESPTGERLVAASPVVLEEIFKVMMKYFQDNSVQ